MTVTGLKSDIGNLFAAARLAYRSDPGLFTVRLVMVTVQGVLPVATLYVLKLLIDAVGAVGEGGGSQLWMYAALFCGIFVLGRVVTLVTELLDELLSHRLTDLISEQLHEQSTSLDLSYYDNPEYHDTLHRAQAEAGFRPMAIVQNMTGIGRNLLSLAGILALLVSLSWQVILILGVAAVPSLIVRLVQSKKQYAWQRQHTELYRASIYFSRVLTGRHFAKDVRVFGLGGFFRERYKGVRRDIVQNLTRIARERFRLSSVSVVFEGAGLLLIFALLYARAAEGAITVGGFVMFFEAFRRGQGSMQGLVSSVTGLYNHKLFIAHLYEFLELQPSVACCGDPVGFPERLQRGVLFEGVSFSYPGSEKRVLDGFELDARPGKITRITGRNGAGKTTVIKLLCRLYECHEGRITIDGIDIRTMDPEVLRQHIGVMFQDFSQFDLTAEENIVLGDLARESEQSAVQRAAEVSSAAEVVAGLPEGYATMLGRTFSGGEELSMGQWQRIALARTIYRNAPILVLDEPTSWMDKESQDHFYAALEELKEGRVILLVSHREEELPAAVRDESRIYVT